MKKKKIDIDYDKEEYEESVRIGKIWKDKNLSNKDPAKLAFREHQILSQRVFDEGHVIEAVIILHGLIELELNKLWFVYVICKNPKILETVDQPKEKSYSDLTSLCEELGLLDDDGSDVIENLKEFNKLRNSLSHNFYGVKQKTIKKTEIKKKFERGLNASGIIPLLELRFLQQESKKNPFAKTFLDVSRRDKT